MKNLAAFKKLCQTPGTKFLREFPKSARPGIEIAPAVRVVQKGQSNGVWFETDRDVNGSWFQFPTAKMCVFEGNTMTVMNAFDGLPSISFTLLS